MKIDAAPAFLYDSRHLGSAKNGTDRENTSHRDFRRGENANQNSVSVSSTGTRDRSGRHGSIRHGVGDNVDGRQRRLGVI